MERVGSQGGLEAVHSYPRRASNFGLGKTKTELGDLSDVPDQFLDEVVSQLEALEQLWSSRSVGGITELRNWLDLLNRLTACSRKITLQLCLAMCRCLAADRRGQLVQSVDIQQAFLRMGGIKQVVNAMLQRLSDDKVVAATTNLLTAAIQNSPLAAEALQRFELKNLKLVMRAVERHRKCWEVAEAGCLLLGHLCSFSATTSGSLNPAQTKAHRDCQMILTQEGMLELAADLLFDYVLQVAVLFEKANLLLQARMKAIEKTEKAAKSEVVVVPTRGRQATPDPAEEMKSSVMKGKSGDEIRQAWMKVLEVEYTSARVQQAALQALTLMINGNAEATRTLAGIFGTQQKILEDDAKAAEERLLTKDASKSQNTSSQNTGKEKPQLKPSTTTAFSEEDRRGLTTLESLDKKLQLLLKVLDSRAAKDRPELASKACRLIGLIIQHHRSLVSRVLESGRTAMSSTMVKIRPGRDAEEDRTVDTPFKQLESLVSSLLTTLHCHSENSTTIIAALATLSELRAIALLSVPAGSEVCGLPAQRAWQQMLLKAGGKDAEFLLRKVARRLVESSQQSQIGDHRIRNFKKPPYELDGNAEWLTPRTRKFTSVAQHQAEELAGDALQAHWGEKGAPGRSDVIRGRKEYFQEKERMRLQKEEDAMRLLHPELFPASKQEESESEDEGVDQSQMLAEEMVPPLIEGEKVNEEDLWMRAIGFGVHDEADFDRLWRKPLGEALSRALCLVPASAGSRWAEKAETTRRERAEATGTITEEALNEIIELQMLESTQGRLRARVIVRPQDRIQQNVADVRAELLTKPEHVMSGLTWEISKSLRKSGNLLPKYGISVRVLRRPASLTKITSEPAISLPKMSVSKKGASKS